MPLNQQACRPLRIYKQYSRSERYFEFLSSSGNEDIDITNVTAVNGNDLESIADAIADANIMATAVGARILKYIIPNIVAGLRKRWSRTNMPLNIIICENLNNANKIVEEMIKAQLTDEEKIRFDDSVGLVEASIGRMVPIQTDEMKDGDPLRVCVERYGFLPVDKAAFKGSIPEIKGMVPFEPFDYFVKRKLFIHNMGHACTAYLGGLIGNDYIWQAIDNADIRIIVQNAMIESGIALSKHYNVPLGDLMMHINDLLHRFTNAALKDTCARVGSDAARKMSPSDRMIGSSILAMEEGVTPAYITVGTAACLKRYIDETEGYNQNVNDAVKALSKISTLEKDSAVANLILHYYEMIIDGCSINNLRKEADSIKATSNDDII